VDQGLIDPKQRANMRDLGLSPAHAESALEITYADQLVKHVTLQPDLQFIHDPAADRDRNDVVVGTLRVAIEL
jgi:porin